MRPQTNSYAAGAAVHAECSQSCCCLVHSASPLLLTCALTLQLLLESLRTQVATPFSSLIMSIHCAWTSVSHVRMHLSPGVSTHPTESLTVAQCNQILKLKLETLDIKALAVTQSCCHIFIIQWVPEALF